VGAPRGPKATKFVHPWMGPLQIVESVGYENYLLRRRDKTGKPEDIVAHASFLTTYKASSAWLQQAAADLTTELADEGADSLGLTVPSAGASVLAAAVPSRPAMGANSKRRRGEAATRTTQWADASERLVETRRRRRRNKAGQYVLEIQLRPAGAAATTGDESGPPRWVSVAEYDEPFDSGKVVEDLRVEEGV
jgi:hypothetical protein